jgi:hypothetical protein
MSVRTASQTANADPQHVLAVLTDPEACRRCLTGALLARAVDAVRRISYEAENLQPDAARFTRTAALARCETQAA